MPVTQEKKSNKRRSQNRILNKRAELELAKLEYQRVLKAESRTLTQTEIASAVRVSQPTISEALKVAVKVDEPREGFSSGSLYEMFLRYTAKKLTKARLIDELSKWDYDKPCLADSLDGLLVDKSNTFREVEDALIKGLIGADVYDAVLSNLGK